MGILEKAEHIVGRGRTYITDAESVDDARDYELLVEALVAITGGALRFDRVSCTTDVDGARELRIAQGGRSWYARLSDSDWVDEVRLFGVLNAALADLGADGRFHVVSEDEWGQELGVVYARAEHLGPLRDAGYIVDDDRAEQGPRPDDETLVEDREIWGTVIRAGAVVEYFHEPPYTPMQVTLAHPQDVHGLALPARSIVLYEQGVHCAVIVERAGAVERKTRIPFEDGAWRRDQAETWED